MISGPNLGKGLHFRGLTSGTKIKSIGGILDIVTWIECAIWLATNRRLINNTSALLFVLWCHERGD